MNLVAKKCLTRWNYKKKKWIPKIRESSTLLLIWMNYLEERGSIRRYVIEIGRRKGIRSNDNAVIFFFDLKNGIIWLSYLIHFFHDNLIFFSAYIFAFSSIGIPFIFVHMSVLKIEILDYYSIAFFVSLLIQMSYLPTHVTHLQVHVWDHNLINS